MGFSAEHVQARVHDPKGHRDTKRAEQFVMLGNAVVPQVGYVAGRILLGLSVALASQEAEIDDAYRRLL